MLQNPAYALLSDVRFKLPSYTLIRKKQKPYVLINLSEEAMHDRIQFRDQAFTLQEHHLSVYKEFSLSSNVAISAFHYTALSDKYSLHAYFDHNGNYLRCHVKLLAEDSIIPLSLEEKLYFQRLAQSQINHPLTLILESLKEQYHLSHERLTRAFAQLEALSAKKMDQKYLSAITDTLELVDTVNSFIFNPDTATKNLLLSQAKFVSEAINNPPKKVSPAIHAESSIAQDESKDHAEIQQNSELDELQNEKVALLNQLTKIQKTKQILSNLKMKRKLSIAYYKLFHPKILI